MSNSPRDADHDREGLSSAQKQRSALLRFLESLVDGPKAIALTVFALLGLLFGVFLLVSGVTVSVNGASAVCGSVVEPTKSYTGDQATCGTALSDQAIHASAFFLGGIGYLLFPLASTGNARALFLIGVASAAASLLGLRSGVEPLLAIVPAAYVLGMTALVARKGLSRSDD